MNNGWELKELNHKEHEEVIKDTKKAIIAYRWQGVAKTAKPLSELSAIFEPFVLKMFSFSSFWAKSKNFKRINHKEYEEVTKDTKKAIIALIRQEVAKTA